MINNRLPENCSHQDYWESMWDVNSRALMRMLKCIVLITYEYDTYYQSFTHIYQVMAKLVADRVITDREFLKFYWWRVKYIGDEMRHSTLTSLLNILSEIEPNPTEDKLREFLKGFGIDLKALIGKDTSEFS